MWHDFMRQLHATKKMRRLEKKFTRRTYRHIFIVIDGDDDSIKNTKVPTISMILLSWVQRCACIYFRSSKPILLNEPRFNVNSYGLTVVRRGFYASSPRLCNKLPGSIRECTSVISELKSKLKTHMACLN